MIHKLIFDFKDKYPLIYQEFLEIRKLYSGIFDNLAIFFNIDNKNNE